MSQDSTQRSAPGGRIALSSVGSFDSDLYGAEDRENYSSSLGDEEEEPRGLTQSQLIAREQQQTAGVGAGASDPFDARRQSRVADRDDEYRGQRLNRALSPVRKDAFIDDEKAPSTSDARSYSEIMLEATLAREEAAIMRNIEKKRREEEDRKAAGMPSTLSVMPPPDASTSLPKKRRRWDTETDDGFDRVDKPVVAAAAAASSAAAAAAETDWGATPQRVYADEREGESAQEGDSWDATPRRVRSRWDDATPLVAGTHSDATPLHSGNATPAWSGAGGETPSGKKRSRWDATPVGPTSSEGPTPDQIQAALATMTPDQLQNLRIDAEIAERNKPLTDEDLDAILPGSDEGYEIIIPPESYRPIRTPSRKLLMTPTPIAGHDGYVMPADTPGLKYDIPPTPLESGLPSFNKADDEKYFGALMEEVDESQLTAAQQKERRIMKLLLKIKNGTPPQRKTAMRQITDKAREFGAAPLFDQILPLLMSPSLEDQERHFLVKVIDRILYKLDDLVRPYTHKILVVIEPLLIDEDYYARVEGREIVSNLAKAAGLATMIATMRPDIDSADEYVRNVTARAFAVVASALGIHALLPFLKAVCQSKRSWEARHTGIKIVQQIAILMGCAVLSHLKALIEIIEHGLGDEESKVRCITALSLAALAEASYPYGIESFDSVLRPLWKGIRQHRGRTLAAFLKAIGYIIPLMDTTYASYYTKEVMVILIREFATPDEEMKKIVLKVVKQCVQTEGVEADYVRKEIVPEFFRNFWVRRMALDKRNYQELVETTESLAVKVGGAEIISRIVNDLKDESEPYRKMVMETIEKVMSKLGSADVDEKLEQSLIDGILYAFQEQTSEDTKTMLNGFGVVVNALGQRVKLYLPQIAGIIKWRLNNKLARVRQQAADLIARIAIVMAACNEEQLLCHLGVVLYEYLGEEYPEVLGSILGALKAIVNVIGMEKMTPPIKDLLPRLTPILRNRHEKVQENAIDLVGRIADRGAEYVGAKEWMRICFELLEMLKAHKKGIRRASVNCFPMDHEILTDQGFMSYYAALQHLQTHPSLNVACYVKGQLIYSPIPLSSITHVEGSHTLVNIESSQVGLSITPTSNHRMWCRINHATSQPHEVEQFTDSSQAFHIREASDILDASHSHDTQCVQFTSTFEEGVHNSLYQHDLPFVSALDLTTDDQIDAFLQLYGYWLHHGSADDSSICFHAPLPENCSYLQRLFDRLSLPSLTLSSSNLYSISNSNWFHYFSSSISTAASLSSPTITPSPTPISTTDSLQSLFTWVWQAPTNCIRAIIKGLKMAQGFNSQTSKYSNHVTTSSVQFRDELVRLCIHAGYSVSFHHESADSNVWMIEYSEHSSATKPTLRADSSNIHSTAYTGGVWCVTVPTPDQLIMVRRVLSSEKDGVVNSTSCPLIVGNTFGYIAKAIGPHDVLATLLNNLKVQERQNRVCTTVAIAIVAETCAPFTVLPALMNEYRVQELNAQNGVLKSLSFLFEYIGEMGKDYVYATLPLLEDALMDRDLVHRQTASSVIKHMSLGVAGLNREDAMAHILNFVWPNIFETSPHLINAVMDAIEGLRVALGPTKILQYLLQGLFHPARKVRTVYWKLYNTLYIASQDALVPAYPRLTEPEDDRYRRWEMEQFL